MFICNIMTSNVWPKAAAGHCNNVGGLVQAFLLSDIFKMTFPDRSQINLNDRVAVHILGARIPIIQYT